MPEAASLKQVNIGDRFTASIRFSSLEDAEKRARVLSVYHSSPGTTMRKAGEDTAQTMSVASNSPNVVRLSCMKSGK